MNAWAISVLATLAYTGSAGAGVYRCTVNGRVVYTDIACGPNAAPADLPELSTVQAGPHANLAKQFDDDARRQSIAVRKARAEESDAYAKKTAKEAAIHKAVIEDRIVAGMTPAQVEGVLNLPTQIDDQGGPHERWIYRNGRERRTIQFKNGVVASDRNAASGTRR